MYVGEYRIFCFASIAHCSNLGLHLALPGAQDAVDADNESRTVAFVPFRCNGCGKANRIVNTIL